ncbi:MAG: ClpXP protease specificity-enhancing factor [Spongiibacter sp.]|uniref:ClpXP protease specificity-enhancing factor n=1 Tax=Spongiibacter thalassae TaxID=2721624 RepID=A0ABX1GIU1_9GAMM|nr:ClpXP protease specificity-enhancing factor [Spongiibacter thalassae]MDX1504549.1 ClpXP protease specificity-enhancing factor [Spongiibacter sp.]NKI18896.1 ClpXP protease specificity-enhancing factor [Spongiibacter thalassae]
MVMTSSKPYMIRAIYEWVVDNDCTPYILVNALVEGVEVPQQFVQDGQIVLNISPSAVVGLDVGNDELGFRGRFGGVAQEVRVPVSAVLGIYARENGQGMLFDAEEPAPDGPPAGGGGGTKPKPASTKPTLKVVK